MEHLKTLVAREYDSGADGYARFAEPVAYRHLCTPLVEALGEAGGPVLDVASGTGALAARLPDSVALDISSGALARNPARRRVCADGEYLPFAGDTFAAAASAFGLLHFPDPVAGVREMARVARTVASLTWVRPESPFPPKETVKRVLAEHVGAARLEELRGDVDRLADGMGSTDAVQQIMGDAGVDADVGVVEVSLPWPGAEPYVRYRLSLFGGSLVEDEESFMRDAVRAVDSLPVSAFDWRARLVLALGRRRTP